MTGYDRSPDYGGPEPRRPEWLVYAVVGGAILFGWLAYKALI